MSSMLRRCTAIAAAAAVALIAWAGAGPQRASADHQEGVLYVGVTSEPQAVSVSVVGSTATIDLSLRNPPSGCADRVRTTVPMNGHTASASGLTVGGLQDVSVSIVFGPDGTATGTLTGNPPAGRNCPRYNLTWAASTLRGGAAPVVATVYTGRTNMGATVRVEVAPDGTISHIALGAQGDGPCTYEVDASPFGERSAKTFVIAASAEGRLLFLAVGSTSGGRMSGAFGIGGAPGCMPVVGTFTASAPGTSPSAQSASSSPSVPSTQPVAAGTGTILSGSIPPEGGLGLIVFGGGTKERLLAASGCPAATAVFWATVRGEFVAYVPGSSVAVVNEAWNAAFPAGIPPSTTILGRCV